MKIVKLNSSGFTNDMTETLVDLLETRKERPLSYEELKKLFRLVTVVSEELSEEISRLRKEGDLK